MNWMSLFHGENSDVSRFIFPSSPEEISWASESSPILKNQRCFKCPYSLETDNEQWQLELPEFRGKEEGESMSDSSFEEVIPVAFTPVNS
jgi:hypothetical protein